MILKRKRTRRTAIVIGTLIAAYAIAGFFVVPPIARSQIEKRASAALGRATTVEKVRFNPFALSVAVEGLRIADRDGGELASWRRAYVNFDPLTSLFKREWHLGELSLMEPRQRIAIDKEGRLSIADLLEAKPAAEPPAPAPAGPMPAVGVGKLSIENWALEFSDASRRTPFRTVIGPMTFSLTGFSTKPEANSPYSFAGATDTGESFAWSGTLSIEPLGSRGHIELKDISIPKHQPFVEHLHHAEVRSGRVTLKTDYEVQLAGTTIVRLANTSLEVAGVAIGRSGEAEPFTALRRLTVEMPAADLMARTAEVARIAIDGFDVQAVRRADGTIDLLDLTAPAAPGAAAPTGAGAEPDSGPAPSVRVAEIALTDSRVALTDQSNPRPAQLVLDQIAIRLANAGTDLDREIGMDAGLRWAGRGTLGAKGTVRVLPFAARFDVKGDALDLSPLDPFIEPFANVHLTSGDVRFAGRIEAARDAATKQIAATWSGDAGLDGLATTDSGAGGALLAWKSLTLAGTTFSLDPLEFTAKEIALVEPFARIAVDAGGAVNLASLSKQATEPAGPAEAPAAAAPPEDTRTSARLTAATQHSLPFKARIDAITIESGRVSISDEAFGPGFRTELRDFSGSIRGLSSENLARADVDLSGKLDGVAPLRIRGSINPLAQDKFSDVTVVFSNIDLPIFSPYTGHYIGQKIQKGKLTIDLAYKLSQNVIEGENRLVLDQFYLGEKVPSPDALKLPVGLAIAVLRERDGRIPIDLPVRGSLDDPNFKIGGVIWQAVRNIFVKAATAPFALLGGMFGGGKDQDLSYIDFASAASEPAGAEEDKIGVLVKMLAERPALRMEIHAPPAPDGDRAGLRALRLAALLATERAQLAPSPAATATATAPAAGDDELVRQLFARQFPSETVAPVAATPAPVAAPAEEKPPGFIARSFARLRGRPATSPEPATAVATTPAPTPAATEATAPAPITVEQMRARLLESIELTAADFAQVAAGRARFVRERLLAGGTIEPERVFLTDAPTVPEGATTATEGARLFFVLQ